MTVEPNNSKITTQHLVRKAVVYVRQSTERQVQQHIESKRLQYALANRARELGFKEVEVIDADLGASASMGACERVGFDRMLALVAKREVGIILSLEVSRLSRTDKDWCRLLEVCQIFDTLIGDAEQVYDVSRLDDQLILGIKGTLSVVEVKMMQKRLQAGQEEKARRGELFRTLPAGYMGDGMGRVVKDADKRVQEAISLVFRKFRELWSVRQTFLWFHTEGVELPVNKTNGKVLKIVWQLPSKSYIRDILQNAFYAGAYVYGRRQRETKIVDGKVVKQMGRVLKPEECRVFIPNHHEGYVDWATYKENAKLITGNSIKRESEDPVPAVRAGQGLLVGILRCGRCGRKLHVRYWGRSGTAARYLCKGDFETGGKYCLGFGGSTVDRRFSQELLKVLSPLGIRASLEAIKRYKTESNGKRTALQSQLEQMEYEAKRAFEQYNEVDARNRLVAYELERRWNEKLEEVGKIKSCLAALEEEDCSLSAQERKKILDLGEDFSQVWESENCTPETKKKIIRTVVEEVIAYLDDAKQMLRFIIHWKGGSHTQFEMEKPRSGSAQKTSLEDLEIIRRMGVRYGDDEIARVLNKLGRQTTRGKRWNEQRVRAIRYKYSIQGQKRPKPDSEILSLGQATKHCDVSQTTIKKLVNAGILKKEQVAPWAPWEIRRADLDAEPVRSIMDNLRKTGKLVIKGDNSIFQQSFFE